MEKGIDAKIADLSSKEKYRFYERLDEILGDRYTSAQYGVMGKDYDSLPAEKIQEAKKILYREMFEKAKSRENN